MAELLDILHVMDFARLLRRDVVDRLTSLGLDPREDFIAWWAVEGRHEYPAWVEVPQFIRKRLFRPLSGWPVTGGLGMSRLLRYVLATEPDMAETFDVSDPQGLEQANAWLFVHYLRHRDGFDIIYRRVRDLLNEPLPNESEDQSDAVDVAPSRLMRWLLALRPDVQRALPDNSPYELVGWALSSGIPEMKVTPLVDDEWRAWALEPTPSVEGLQRIGHLIWHVRENVRQTFDLRTPLGKQELARWTERALVEDSGFAWLKRPPVAHVPGPSSHRNDVTAIGVEAKAGVNLIGFAFGELGIGEDVRMAAAACEQAGIPYAVLNIPPGPDVRQSDRILTDRVVADAAALPFSINIFCLTGFDTAGALLKCGSGLFQGRYCIGWWPWELPVWPQAWRKVFDLVDEVWAATDFTQQLYTSMTRRPVVKMPLPVSVARVRRMDRAAFGIPNGAFAFLFIFDSNSSLNRKNPEGVVHAFQRAFSHDDASVSLVLKTMNTKLNNNSWSRLKAYCTQDPRIVIIETTLDREQILGLVQVCDAYVSLHRAEGFGRTLAEAMLLGKVVVGTDFSGNVDFLTDDVGFPVRWHPKVVEPDEYYFIADRDSAWWADPDLDHAAQQMRAARTAATDGKFASRVLAYAETRFSPTNVGKLMQARIREIRLGREE